MTTPYKLTEEELGEFIEVYAQMVKIAVEKLKSMELSDAIAHLLGEIMKGVDKACGKRKEDWTREEVFRLIEALKPSVSQK